MWFAKECRWECAYVCVCVDREGRPENRPSSPTIARRRGDCARGCTSLPCTSGIVRTPCPATKRTEAREQKGDG